MATTQIKDGYNGGSDNQLKVNSNGSIDVNNTGGGGTGNVNITEIGGNPVTTTLPVASESDGAVGATPPAFATQVGGVGVGGTLQPLQLDPSGKLLVDITGSSTVTGTVNANIEGLTSFQTSQYMVGLTAVQLAPTPLTNRSSLSIKAQTTSSLDLIYIGNSNAVTTSTGYPLFFGDSLQLDLTPAQQLWAIGTSAGQIAYLLEIGD